MPRFFGVFDTHIKSGTPQARRDVDFLATSLGKLEYILAQAEEQNVDAILIPGDLFHNYSPTIKVINKASELLTRYPDIPIITCLGNHDFPGGRIAAYRNETVMGLLETYSLITVLHAGKTWEWGDIVVSGYGWEEPETRDFLDGLQNRPRNDTKFRIALVHAPYGGTEDKMGLSKCITSCHAKGVDVALVGDIHDDPFFDVALRSGVRCYNSGALVRLNKTEMDRPIKYLDLDISGPHEAPGVTEEQFRKQAKVKKESFISINASVAHVWTTKERDVPHLPAVVAFDTEKINEQIAESAQSFEAAILMTKKAKSESPKETLLRVGSEANFTSESIRMAIDNLDKDVEE